MTSVQILYWHDIPVQVRAGGRRERAGVELSQRFQTAVDSAAMAAGLVGTDAYLDGFRWGEPFEADGEPAEAATRVAAELEAANAVIAWQATAARLRGDHSAGAGL